MLWVSDSRLNALQVEVDMDEVIGSVRNSLNKALKCGYSVGECDLVPSPFCHYVETDPELFGKGPSDEWRVADVFFEALTTADVIKAMSVVPLGPTRRIGVVFPDFSSPGSRKIDATSPLYLAAKKILSPRQMTERVECLIDTLESVERGLARRHFARESVVGVAGFGFDGEVAALIYAGSLTFEDGIRAIEATERRDVQWTAYSMVGQTTENGDDEKLAFSHFVLKGARVCVARCDEAPPSPVSKRLEHRLIETTGAHTPFCVLDEFEDADYDISKPITPFYSSRRRQTTPSLRHTLFSPVAFADTIQALVDDQAPTELLVPPTSSSRDDKLSQILVRIAPHLI